MERKIGEIFTTKDGVKLRVEECVCCDNCHYDKKEGYSMFNHEAGACFKLVRKDNKSVIFKQIKK